MKKINIENFVYDMLEEISKELGHSIEDTIELIIKKDWAYYIEKITMNIRKKSD